MASISELKVHELQALRQMVLAPQRQLDFPLQEQHHSPQVIKNLPRRARKI